MSRWATITVDDLNDAKVAALIDACRTAALGAGQTDPMPRIIADVTTEIRLAVASCRTNRLDADDTTVPGNLKRLGCRMIVREMMSRLQQALSDDEQRERDNDRDDLVRVSKCELAVLEPDAALEPAPVQRGGGAEVVARPFRVTPCETFNGL